MGKIKLPTQADGTIAWDKLEVTIITTEAERPASMEERRRIIAGLELACASHRDETRRRIGRQCLANFRSRQPATEFNHAEISCPKIARLIVSLGGLSPEPQLAIPRIDRLGALGLAHDLLAERHDQADGGIDLVLGQLLAGEDVVLGVAMADDIREAPRQDRIAVVPEAPLAHADVDGLGRLAHGRDVHRIFDHGTLRSIMRWASWVADHGSYVTAWTSKLAQHSRIASSIIEKSVVSPGVWVSQPEDIHCA